MHELTNHIDTTPNTTAHRNTAFTLEKPKTHLPVIGTATVDHTAGKPVVTPYYSAVAAMRWTADRTSTWQFGSDTDPGVRYPLAVLTAARAEARYWLAAGTVYPEAANLSDAGTSDVVRPRPHTLERVRDNAIHSARAGTITAPAQLAAAVDLQLTPDITAEQTAAIIWYYALILWGASAP
jgi:hypothetical protein